MPLAAVFADLPAPRRETANTLPTLTDIWVVATCAVIGGADTWGDIAEYGGTKEAFFRRFLPPPEWRPHADTFARAFAKLDPARFAQAFGRRMRRRARPPGWCRWPWTARRRGRPKRAPPPGAGRW